MKNSTSEPEATCIGCGCTDSQACYDEKKGTGCHWVRLEGVVGVCSACPKSVVRAWDGGERAIRAGAA